MASLSQPNDQIKDQTVEAISVLDTEFDRASFLRKSLISSDAIVAQVENLKASIPAKLSSKEAEGFMEQLFALQQFNFRAEAEVIALEKNALYQQAVSSPEVIALRLASSVEEVISSRDLEKLAYLRGELIEHYDMDTLIPVVSGIDFDKVLLDMAPVDEEGGFSLELYEHLMTLGNNFQALLLAGEDSELKAFLKILDEVDFYERAITLLSRLQCNNRSATEQTLVGAAGDELAIALLTVSLLNKLDPDASKYSNSFHEHAGSFQDQWLKEKVSTLIEKSGPDRSEVLVDLVNHQFSDPVGLDPWVRVLQLGVESVDSLVDDLTWVAARLKETPFIPFHAERLFCDIEYFLNHK